MANLINSVWVGEELLRLHEGVNSAPSYQYPHKPHSILRTLPRYLENIWQRLVGKARQHSSHTSHPTLPSGSNHPADNLDALVYIINSDRRFVFVNSKFEEIFQRKREDIIGKTNAELVGAKQADLFWQSDLQVMNTGQRIRGIHTLERSPSDLRHYCYVKSPVSHYHKHVIGIYTDITEFYDQSQELYVRATTDSLTGLSNRSHFFEHFKQQFSASIRHKTPLSLLVIDIDHFKRINDTYGHPVGDQVIRRLGKLIQVSLRHEDLAARVGGEEYCILLPSTNAEQAHMLAERIRQATESLHIKPAEIADDIRVTVSIGITSVARYDQSHEDTYARADSALYQAKRTGRNQVKARV